MALYIFTACKKLKPILKFVVQLVIETFPTVVSIEQDQFQVNYFVPTLTTNQQDDTTKFCATIRNHKLERQGMPEYIKIKQRMLNL